MERKKYILIFIFALFTCALCGQNNKSVYKAYVSGNMNIWKCSIDSMEAARQKTNQEVLDLINYQYGYIAWCIGKNFSVEAGEYLEKATENLEKLEQKKYNLSMLYAYKAAFIGFEIGLSPQKIPFIGYKSSAYAKKSIDIDSTNSMANIQLGNIAYYKPIVLGGSKTEALLYYLLALKTMENNIGFKANNWNYLNLLATVIKVYIDLHQYETAEKYCIKTLAVEPDFDWVKNHLYPQVLKIEKP